MVKVHYLHLILLFKKIHKLFLPLTLITNFKFKLVKGSNNLLKRHEVGLQICVKKPLMIANMNAHEIVKIANLETNLMKLSYYPFKIDLQPPRLRSAG